MTVERKIDKLREYLYDNRIKPEKRIFPITYNAMLRGLL
jgi:hypothetical protein